MNVNALEFLGRLARAKENVKIAQREINAAMQLVLERKPIRRENLDLSGYVATAMISAEQAVADLQTLGENLKSV
jgi:hypothetical protein